MGIDEADVGGRRRVKYQPSNKKPVADKETEIKEFFARKEHHRNKGMDPFDGKAAVASLVRRGGKVRSMHIECVTGKTLKPILDEMRHKDVDIMTDSSSVLDFSQREGRRHDKVNHTAKEYVRFENGLCSTTTAVQGYIATLKR